MDDMESGEYASMAESLGPSMRRRPSISTARRRELLRLAVETAEHIQAKMEAGEARLFRHMLDLILDT